MKPLNEYKSLHEYIEDCQRENAEKHEIPDEVKKEMIANRQDDENYKNDFTAIDLLKGLFIGFVIATFIFLIIDNIR